MNPVHSVQLTTLSHLLLAEATSTSMLVVAGSSTVSDGVCYLCGLGADGSDAFVLLCWPPGPAAPYQLRRVCRGAAPLADLAVGDDHIAYAQHLMLEAYDRYPQLVEGGRRRPRVSSKKYKLVVLK
jgi:hypothetical protein